MRAAAAAHAASLVSSAARLALRSQSARDAFDWAERGRTAVLRHSPVSPPRDPELAEALARYRWAARNDEEARLDGALDRDATSSRGRDEAAVLRLTRRNAGDHPGLTPATVREVRARLRGETFVQLLEVEGMTYAVVLGRRRPALVALAPSADIASALATTMFGLRRTLVGFGRAASRAASAGAIRQGLLSLDARLVEPLRALLDEGGVTVCPTASLASVPWAALPSLRDRVVRVAPSATSWCRARDASPGPRSVVAVAGPGLPGAEAEVCSVAALHEGAVALVGEQATVGAVLEATSGASLLHLAAHGRLRTDNPLFSALELVDGPLTAYDLESLPHVPATACSRRAARVPATRRSPRRRSVLRGPCSGSGRRRSWRRCSRCPTRPPAGSWWPCTGTWRPASRGPTPLPQRRPRSTPTTRSRQPSPPSSSPTAPDRSPVTGPVVVSGGGRHHDDQRRAGSGWGRRREAVRPGRTAPRWALTPASDPAFGDVWHPRRRARVSIPGPDRTPPAPYPARARTSLIVRCFPRRKPPDDR